MKTTYTKNARALSGTLTLFAAGVFACTSLTLHAQTTTLSYTGALQTYTVPVGVTYIQLECLGAQGSGGNGGLGGYTRGNMTVTPGQVLNIYVGGQAGYNGGGLGHAVGNRNGGGASDVRVSPYALANRVIVAGAGGGGGPTDVGVRNGGTGGGGTVGSNYAGGGGGDGYGGNGGPGGLNGGTGNTSCHSGGAGGGGLNSGGAPSCNTCYTSTCGQAGTLGQGGAADVWENGICYTSYGGTNGGGGGYYGGGGSSVGNCGGGGGGGGSSWVGTLTNITMTGGIRTGNGQIVITVLSGVNITQSTQILCFGQASATLTAAPFGGTSPYTYSWAPSGGTSATATGLIAGTYTVTVTDAASAVTTQTFTVTQPSLLTATSSSTSPTCFGNSNGTASVAPSGGTSPYTYLWSNGQTTLTTTGVVVGNYTCTVTCTNGCTTSTSATVTQPSVLSASLTATATMCSGGNTGSASASATGGTSPYTYIWSNAGTTATINGLAAGVYTCTVTCSNGCTTSQSVTVTSPSLLTTTASSSSLLCNGDTATVTVAAAGGTSPYTGAGAFMEMAGTYTYTVSDANGCTSTTSVTITEPTAISAGIVSIDVTCNGGVDGSIDLTVSGGTSPYTFDWNSATYTTEDLTGLSAGTYVGVLTDANGCTNSGTVTITEPSALVATLAIANDTVCSTDGSFTLTGESPVGGVFSGPGVAAGSFSPATAGVGVHVITYLYTDSSGCTATTTDSINVDVCTDIQFPVSGSEFSVYPNPNDGTFVLQTTSAAAVMIYDAQGKIVYTQKVQSNVATPMNIATAGMYMITVVTADGQRTSQRVMVTK